jgi:hypothetical protein
MLDLLERSMTALAQRRPLFHGEADFQLALGWELHIQEPSAHVRLGQRLLRDPTVALDVLIRLGDGRYGLELKYLKTHLSADVEGEHFDLAPSATDVDRYDVLRNVARLERLVDGGAVEAGSAIALSNAAELWDGASGDAFALHEGRQVAGPLEWATAQPRRGRENPIELRGAYTLHWRPYARVAEDPNGELRYLAIAVTA